MLNTAPGNFLPRVSNVTYRNVDQRGCSTPVVLLCNASFPCEHIVFDGVKTYADFEDVCGVWCVYVFTCAVCACGLAVRHSKFITGVWEF